MLGSSVRRVRLSGQSWQLTWPSIWLVSFLTCHCPWGPSARLNSNSTQTQLRLRLASIRLNWSRLDAGHTHALQAVSWRIVIGVWPALIIAHWHVIFTLPHTHTHTHSYVHSYTHSVHTRVQCSGALKLEPYRQPWLELPTRLVNRYIFFLLATLSFHLSVSLYPPLFPSPSPVCCWNWAVSMSRARQSISSCSVFSLFSPYSQWNLLLFYFSFIYVYCYLFSCEKTKVVSHLRKQCR